MDTGMIGMALTFFAIGAAFWIGIFYGVCRFAGWYPLAHIAGFLHL